MERKHRIQIYDKRTGKVINEYTLSDAGRFAWTHAWSRNNATYRERYGWRDTNGHTSRITIAAAKWPRAWK